MNTTGRASNLAAVGVSRFTLKGPWHLGVEVKTLFWMGEKYPIPDVDWA